MEIHLQIPAERWCVTKWEFFRFIEEVRRLWKQGLLPNSAELPNPKHHLHAYGPNLYQVNTHYVKPVTLAAGGMSYALMKHPKGLICHVFVSHAWSEGVFELGNHVRSAWPRGLRLRNIYCCLLANPQNLDIESMLDCHPLESPFAKAMQCASHVVVSPNDTVSIYQRLWCVYEIFLATEWKKICVIPAKPPASRLCSMIKWTCLFPTILGGMIGCGWAIVIQAMQQPHSVHARVADGILCACIAAVVFTCLIDVVILTRAFWLEASCIRSSMFRAVRSGLQVLSALCIAPWFVLPCRSPPAVYDKLLHYGVPLAVWGAAAAAAVRDAVTELENAEIQRQASFLSFEGLEFARCSSTADESRIRGAIAEREEDVIMSIQVLKSAGAHNHAIRQAHTRGLDITGSGNNHTAVRLVSGIMPWWVICLVEEMGAAHVWDVACACPSDVWIYTFALIIFLSAGGMICGAFFWMRKGPIWVNLVIHTCTILGFFVDAMPYGVAGVQGWQEFHRLPVFLRMAHAEPPASCPSFLTWWFAVPMRPCVALLALGLAWLGPAAMQMFLLRRRSPSMQDLTDLESNGSSRSVPC
ncbi:unnamed protein product [Symbiodinium sp. CCMP2456]|nr:unnamed protein product [Symbiodinium sp. CCMP2456]